MSKKKWSSEWSSKKIETLTKLYPSAGWAQILRRIPHESKENIILKAEELGLKRKQWHKTSRPGMAGGKNAYDMDLTEWEESPEIHNERMLKKYNIS